jgi:hypothetical protein
MGKEIAGIHLDKGWLGLEYNWDTPGIGLAWVRTYSWDTPGIGLPWVRTQLGHTLDRVGMG